MQTNDGIQIGVEAHWGMVELGLGSERHLLDAETAIRLGAALVEATGPRPATAFVRSVVARDGRSVTVEAEGLGTGVRVLVDDVRLEFSAPDAGELALELLRNGAGLRRQLTFAAWPDGAWLSARRRAGELEAAIASAVRAASSSAAERVAIVHRVLTALGGALPGRELGDGAQQIEQDDESARLGIDELTEELGGLGVPAAFVRGIADETLGRPHRRAALAAVERERYGAGRKLVRGIGEALRRRR